MHRRGRGFALVELLLVLLVLGALIVVGMRMFHKKAASPAVPQVRTQTLKGVSLSPRSFSAADFNAFLDEAAKSGSVVTWAGNWTQLQNPGSAPFTVAKLAKARGYQPILIIGANDQASGNLDSSAKQAFITAVRAFAADYKPAYLGLGNEVNRLRAKSPAGYAEFTGWFGDAAAAIKQASPATKVFTTFQYEQLNGLNGGLFGGQNDPAANQWQLVSDFPAADLIAFTTYPYIIYHDPSEIPADYYARASQHITKPLAFTEIGWPSQGEAAGYESTPAIQTAFIGRFAELARSAQAQFVVWPFLYDQALPVPFVGLGLIDASNNPKPALAIWQSTKFE
ncbi:MAG TPA: hypothetical protein VL737_05305 [Candidatus Pristimantibacillus sp.]|nr:hypothetical protein [Candidatus Pristimantibacillus sp.]